MTTSRKFGNLYKGPTHVAIDITSQCNMKCLHCYNRSGGLAWENMDLNEATWLRFSKEIRRLEPCSFCFCGGEPLIRFGLVIAMLKRIRNSITQIGLVSNGFLLTEEKAECLVQNGLGLLQISLDGAQAETHDRLRGVDGCHVRALNAIKIAHKAGVENLVVAFSPTCFNIPEFSCLVKKLSDVGVGKIRVQPLMGLGNGCLNRNIFPTEQQYHLLHDTILDLSATYNSVKIEWGDPVDHLLRNVELISEFVPYVSVRSNGDITLSPYLPIVVGNLTRHTLSQYWNAEIWRIWEVKLFQDIASNFSAVKDFSRVDLPIPHVFFDEDIYLDLIDDELFFKSETEHFRLYWTKVKALLSTKFMESFSHSERLASFANDLAPEDVNKLYLAYGASKKDWPLKSVKKGVDLLLGGRFEFKYADGFRTLTCEDTEKIHEFTNQTTRIDTDIYYFSSERDADFLRRKLFVRSQLFNYHMACFAVFRDNSVLSLLAFSVDRVCLVANIKCFLVKKNNMSTTTTREFIGLAFKSLKTYYNIHCVRVQLIRGKGEKNTDKCLLSVLKGYGCKCALSLDSSDGTMCECDIYECSTTD